MLKKPDYYPHKMAGSKNIKLALGENVPKTSSDEKYNFSVFITDDGGIHMFYGG